MERSSDLQLTMFLRFVSRLDLKSEEPISWLKERGRAKALGAAVFSQPLFSGIRIAQIEDDKPKAVTAASAAALLATGANVLAEFRDSDGIDSDLFVGFILEDGYTELRISAAGAALADHRETALDDLIAAAQVATVALRGCAGLQYGHVTPSYTTRFLNYPLARPPRINNYYPAGSIVEFIDRDFHASSEYGARPGDPQALTVPQPPAPATMSENHGLVVVRWAAGLADDALVAGASGHDAWIGSRIEADLRPGFNELGDRCEYDQRAKPATPLTLYVPDTRVGYKAVLVLPDGSIEPSAWEEARRVLAARCLPDGAPVDSVRIVVPLREHVFLIAERARKAGFSAVLYPDPKRGFWNPDPPGEWLSPPIIQVS